MPIKPRHLLVGVLLPATHVWADESSLTWALSSEARYEDNIGFAPDDPSKRDDLTTRVAGTVTWEPVQTAVRQVSFTAGPYYDFVKDLVDLSNGGAVVGVRLLQQLSTDFTSPWVALSSEARWMSYKDSEIRDGYRIDSELTVGKRFNEKFGVSIGYRYQIRVSTEDNPEGTLVDPILGDRHSNEVFDQDRHGPFVNLEFDPFPRTTLFAEYSYLSGEVAATADAAAFTNPEDFDSARDFAFDEGIRFLCWKVDADQNIYTMGATQAISNRWQANLTADYLDAKAESGNDYSNWVVTLGVSFSL